MCSSEYASPVIIVKKKDGSPQLCINYRKLNKVTVRDKYPLPVTEDQIDRLAKARIFSTIDLRNGFFHVDVEAKSRKYTAFVTKIIKVNINSWKYLLACETYRLFINHIFWPLVNDRILLVYLDDLIIIAPDVEEGIQHLQKVLQVASDMA